MTRVSSALLFIGLLNLLPSAYAQVELDVEELRLENAATTLPSVVSRYQGLVNSLASQYRQNTDEFTVTQLAARQGERLWQQAVRDVQSGSLDDRPLYWSRLAMLKELKTTKPAFNIVQWQREILINAIEKSSRGLSNIQFDDDAQIKILLSGFDPFFLDRNIDQSNPSGLVALALDGYKFTVAGKKAQIETVMIPVRFTDFDQGLIESLLTPIYRENSVDIIFTVSMGRDDFDLERFPGRNRSAAAPDNLNVQTGANKQAPLAPMFEEKSLNGPEFVEFSLPVKAMQAVEGKWKVNDNHSVTTLAKGAFEASSLAELQSSISVEGSGGGYLSNEISYRAVLLGQQLNSKIPVGHIHTPRVTGYDADTEAQILEQVKVMVIAASKGL
ncbi:hypothetical protein HWQ46_23155 [Shewanella sp. D64]|uniref:hypothetical protein n=1 Tax=unclassified Shewanella TaxID=196818 RepID=UPI0022BA5456|nr:MULTISPECIES: hypothetical protein [unclassified Shewanella]MEC4728430.1 hypothetical protein [Shewanella sp. D64]MEC4740197.1 hypothetical protein [Shewanella sp. E94]WBJ96273.1 hypothetical protein HWQ47_03865 [Shewanella sp. MTB7]